VSPCAQLIMIIISQSITHLKVPLKRLTGVVQQHPTKYITQCLKHNRPQPSATTPQPNFQAERLKVFKITVKILIPIWQQLLPTRSAVDMLTMGFNSATVGLSQRSTITEPLTEITTGCKGAWLFLGSTLNHTI